MSVEHNAVFLGAVAMVQAFVRLLQCVLFSSAENKKFKFISWFFLLDIMDEKSELCFLNDCTIICLF